MGLFPYFNFATLKYVKTLIMIFNGKELAKEMIEDLKIQRSKFNHKIRLNIISLKNDSDMVSFIKSKQNIAQELNIECRVYQIEESIKTKDLRKKISTISRTPYSKGMVIQLPLPESINTQTVLDGILETQDIDCLSSKTLGKFYTGKSIILPPVVSALKLVSEKNNISFNDKKIVIIGSGTLTGKPIATWFLTQNIPFELVNETTTNILEIIKSADILITGVGKPRLIKELKKDCIVFDFGCSRLDNSLTGDCEQNCSNNCSFFTPVPGGLGPVVVACLYQNLFKLLNER